MKHLYKKSIFEAHIVPPLKKMKKILIMLKNFREYKKGIYKYRLIGIEENKHEVLQAIIQITNTKSFFCVQPDEILSDDSFTDAFSPRDIRALSYLACFKNNFNKYKMIANSSCEKDKNEIYSLLDEERKNLLKKLPKKKSKKLL